MSGRAVVTHLQLRIANNDWYNQSFLRCFVSERLKKKNGDLLLKCNNELVMKGD